MEGSISFRVRSNVVCRESEIIRSTVDPKAAAGSFETIQPRACDGRFGCMHCAWTAVRWKELTVSNELEIA